MFGEQHLVELARAVENEAAAPPCDFGVGGGQGFCAVPLAFGMGFTSCSGVPSKARWWRSSRHCVSGRRYRRAHRASGTGAPVKGQTCLLSLEAGSLVLSPHKRRKTLGSLSLMVRVKAAPSGAERHWPGRWLCRLGFRYEVICRATAPLAARALRSSDARDQALPAAPQKCAGPAGAAQRGIEPGFQTAA